MASRTVKRSPKTRLFKIEQAREILSVDGSRIQDATHEIRDNPDLITLALETFSGAYGCASIGVQSSLAISIRAIIIDPENLKHAPIEIQTVSEIVMLAVKKNGIMLQFASSCLRNNYDIVWEAVNQNGRAYVFASDELKQDRNLAILAVSSYGRTLRLVPANLRSDPEVVWAAVKENPYSIEFASKEIRSDFEFMKAVINEDKKSWRGLISFAPPDINADLFNWKNATNNY